MMEGGEGQRKGSEQPRKAAEEMEKISKLGPGGQFEEAGKSRERRSDEGRLKELVGS